MKKGIYTTSWKIGNPYGACFEDSHGERRGRYVCYHGVVLMSQYEYPRGKGTTFEFFINGIVYYRNVIGKHFTDIGMARIAGKFVKEIVANIAKQ